MAVTYSKKIKKIMNIVQKWNYDKYFNRRDYVTNHKNLLAVYYLYYIKKTDAFHNASLGTHMGNKSAFFHSRPILPHGLNGIIISNDVTIGKNVQIYHQVTITSWESDGPIIGDNVLIGAGAKIIGNVKIGNNTKVGAGCIVTTDIPDNATVVMQHPRIILKNKN